MRASTDADDVRVTERTMGGKGALLSPPSDDADWSVSLWWLSMRDMAAAGGEGGWREMVAAAGRRG